MESAVLRSILFLVGCKLQMPTLARNSRMRKKDRIAEINRKGGSLLCESQGRVFWVGAGREIPCQPSSSSSQPKTWRVAKETVSSTLWIARKSEAWCENNLSLPVQIHLQHRTYTSDLPSQLSIALANQGYV